MKTNALFLGLFLVACGGAAPAPEHPEHREHREHEKEHEKWHGKGHEEHHKLSPALHEFHEVLGPVWHSTAGAERVTKTCTQASALRDKATATSDGELIATVAALSAACDKEGRADVEARLGAVHERFHALAEHP